MDRTTEEQLDRYLKGQLSAEELLQFKEELNQNPELAAELDMHQDITNGIKTYVHRDLRGKLKGFQKNWYAKQETPKTIPLAPPKRRNLAYPLMAIAATLLLALTAVFWLTQSAATVSTDQLYAAYYQPYAALSTSRDNSGKQELMQANELYKNKKYDQAFLLFEQLLDQKANDSKLLLASGICQMEVGAYEKAMPYFQKIIDNNDLYLTGQATWYIALCYLKQNNLETSKALLQQLLAQPKGDRRTEAQKLLEELK